MRRTFFALSLVVAAVLAMGMGAGGALAQENATNGTAVEAGANYEETVGPNVRLVDWEYTNGQFSLEFEADEPTRVSITEAGTWGEGTGQFNYVEQVVSEGRSTVVVPVSDRDGAAVGITTPASMDQGTGAYVSIGREEQSQNPLKTFGGESGLFTGVLMTIVLAALSAWYVVRSENTGVVEA
ncbi:hypothetical protein SAMN06269185_1494 [Natronoarchaeum philippinense]|uniref:Uncharacterized protein n=1 Tax=Natronoarchaeum philippinense TaxID=558529 RepID=A0A285NSZ5_NATPI|nr:hypothetical protein [Natronoarchaeum philippinense]SNZ12097.1 hypothetical protein SAMN06269185_1494 [Natronoarchaeum philippinense]